MPEPQRRIYYVVTSFINNFVSEQGDKLGWKPLVKHIQGNFEDKKPEFHLIWFSGNLGSKTDNVE